MTYKLELTRAARRELAALSKEIVKRLDACILQLAEDPYPIGCKKLGEDEEVWRVIVGNYRIIYQVEEERSVVAIVRIGYRRNFGY